MASYEQTISVVNSTVRRGDVVVTKILNKNMLVNKGDLLVGTGNDEADKPNGVAIADVATLSSLSIEKGLPLITTATAPGLGYGAIVANGIGISAITNEKIYDYTIETNKIANFAINAMKLGTNAVDSIKINAGAVTTDKIANLNVTTDKIHDSAVNSSKILDGSISTAKFDSTAVAPYASYARRLDRLSNITSTSFAILAGKSAPSTTDFVDLPGTASSTPHNLSIFMSVQWNNAQGLGVYGTSLGFVSPISYSSSWTSITKGPISGTPISLVSGATIQTVIPVFNIKIFSNGTSPMQIQFLGFAYEIKYNTAAYSYMTLDYQTTISCVAII